MSNGMGREFTYLSSHATNRYFIPNWGSLYNCKLQFSGEIINEQNVQTVGMPTAPTISLISCRLSLINSCLAVSLPDNICISNAQYYELNAQQNLWCEILEFWAFDAISLIHSRLCGLQEKTALLRVRFHCVSSENRITHCIWVCCL